MRIKANLSFTQFNLQILQDFSNETDSNEFFKFLEKSKQTSVQKLKDHKPPCCDTSYL